MAKRKNNGPDSLTNYIKGKGGKVRRFANGGPISESLRSLTEYGGGDAKRGLERFVDETRAKEADIHNWAHNKLTSGFGDAVDAVTYPGRKPDVSPQDLFLGKGRQGPLEQGDQAYHDWLMRKGKKSQRLFEEGVPYSDPTAPTEFAKRHDMDDKVYGDYEALWRRRFDKNQPNPLGTQNISDKELMRRLGYKKGGLINKPDSLTNYIKGRNK
tara:strand:+ start:380 stop:1018 length:639 start_codon:yes stop_codon:yes gene_type:complete